MGILTRLLQPDEARSTTSSLKNPDRALIEALRGGIASAAGVYVSEEGALAYGAVLACVRVLSESVASLPCLLYRRVDRYGQGGKERAADHPLYRLLHNRPNPETSAFEFWEMAVVHLLLWGNFYAEIVIDGRGNVAQLWPIPPRLVTPSRVGRNLVYRVDLPTGPRDFGAEWIFHVSGMRTAGLKGMSIVGQARESIGLGMAAERFGAAVFGNGTVPGGVLTHPGQLSDKAYTRLQSSWANRHQGIENAQRLAILEEGMKYDKMGIPPEDAQFLETRKFQRSEIAGMFRVPPHMIADLSDATFSNIEQQNTSFLQHSLGGWLRRIESRVNGWLLFEREQPEYFAEFLVDGFLRGDVASRNTAYATARQWGWMSVNDIRTLENMNPIDGGDVYLQPLNMVDANADQPGLPDSQGAAAPDAPAQPGDQAARAGSPGHSATPAGRMARRAAEETEKVGRGRQRIGASMRPAIHEAARRVVNREVNDVRQAARRLLKTGHGVREFDEWLMEFYRDFDQVVVEMAGPSLRSLAELSRDDVERETGQRWADEALAWWVESYVSSRANIWAGRHRQRLSQVVREAEQARAVDAPAPALAALDGELDHWQQVEADKFANDQTTRVTNAVATAIYTAFTLMMVWFAFGESCDYCSQLSGRVVGSSQWFMQAGEALEGAAGAVLKVSTNVKHAPLHDGCDCVVLAML